jgi:hypothetical protein
MEKSPAPYTSPHKLAETTRTSFPSLSLMPRVSSSMMPGGGDARQQLRGGCEGRRALRSAIAQRREEVKTESDEACIVYDLFLRCIVARQRRCRRGVSGVMERGWVCGLGGVIVS